MTWTRQHDVWIARECEGLEVQKERGLPEYLWRYKRSDGCLIALPSYSTDPAACIRAAEAWRNQKPGRSYETRSRIDDEFGTSPASAVCFSRTNQIAGGGQGESAFAQALYRATGGPA